MFLLLRIYESSDDGRIQILRICNFKAAELGCKLAEFF